MNWPNLLIHSLLTSVAVYCAYKWGWRAGRLDAWKEQANKRVH